MAAANGFVICLSGCVIAMAKPGDLVPPRRRWRAGVLKPMKKVKRRLSIKQQDPSPSLVPPRRRWGAGVLKPMKKVKRRLSTKQQDPSPSLPTVTSLPKRWKKVEAQADGEGEAPEPPRGQTEGLIDNWSSFDVCSAVVRVPLPSPVV